MSVHKPKIALDVLPDDVLTLKDAQFYSLVEDLTSHDVAQILRSQAINSVNTFLLSKNIVESVLLPTSAFDSIRRKVCVKLDLNNNDSYAIHIGIIGQFQYLTELLRKKNAQEAQARPKHRSCSIMHSSSSVAIVPISTPGTNFTATPSSTNNTNINTSVPASIIDHHSKIITAVNKWIIGEGKKVGTNVVKMVEGIDYTVELSSLSERAVIVCKCQARFSLIKSTDETFSLSNLYKHWKSSKKCVVLSSVLADTNQHPPHSSSPQNDSDVDDEDGGSPSSSSPSNAGVQKRTASRTTESTAKRRR